MSLPKAISPVRLPASPACRLSCLTEGRMFALVLEGRRTASGASRGRKVRTPQGAMPRNPASNGAGIHAGGTLQGVSTDSATETQTAAPTCVGAARVKRWGKSPPLGAQAPRHGKPRRVQGQIGDPGAARSRFREGGTGSGYWLLRQMILSPAPQNGTGQTKFGLQPFQNQLLLSG